MGARDFYQNEHVALRDKIEKKVETMERLQILVAGAAGSIFAWLITSKLTAPAALMAGLVPVGLTLLAAWRHHTLIAYVEHTCGYMKSLETYLSEGEGPGGWENAYDANKSGLKWWRQWFWWIMLAFCAAGCVAIWLLKQRETAPDLLAISIAG